MANTGGKEQVADGQMGDRLSTVLLFRTFSSSTMTMDDLF